MDADRPFWAIPAEHVAAIAVQLGLNTRQRARGVNREWRDTFDTTPGIWADVQDEKIRGLTCWCIAARAGGELALEWAAPRYGFTISDITAECDLSGNSPLSVACQHGNVEAAHWFIKGFDIPVAEITRARGALSRACYGGHIELAQWLVTRFGLTPSGDCLKFMFVEACEGGHLGTVQWLAESFEAPVWWLGAYLTYFLNKARVNPKRVGDPKNQALAAWLTERYRHDGAPAGQ